MAPIPYMKFYIADYLADTPHLDTEEHGAYFLLMMNYWQTGKPIPPERLRKIARLSNERWTDVEITLKEFFQIDANGHWFHARIEAELEKVRAKSIKNSEAGKKSAEARRLKAIEKKEESNKRSTNVKRTHERSLNHTDTDTDTDTSKNNTSSADDDAKFNAFWDRYPKKVDKKKARVAFNRLSTTKQKQATEDCRPRYADTPKQFIPNPTTYIHGEKWNDEVIKREATNGNKSADIFEQGTRDAYDR